MKKIINLNIQNKFLYPYTLLMRLITEIITEEEAAELHRIQVAYLEDKIKSYTLEEHMAIVMSKFKE
ncbi:hypothetical protein FACS1894166_03390 [Bacilli bacterium]|nr:hypothetical protein FACS1894166_03390 [Bacilli bacterium]